MHYNYALSTPDADVQASQIQIQEGGYVFTVQAKYWQLTSVQLNMGGLHNVENALAAILVAKQLGIADHLIKESISTFKGVKRRFDFILKTAQHVFIDDYAHHPAELDALIHGVRSLYPNKKMVLVFQPHLNSRTKDFADAFAKSLQNADQVILLPIYPARELPIPGVDAALLTEKMNSANVLLLSKDELIHWVATNRPELLITAGAGDIDKMIEPLKEKLIE